MAATAVSILPGPACEHCKGGRVINGVPCADCDGTGRQGAVRRRLRWPSWLLRVADAAAAPAGLAVRGAPGIGGAAAVALGGAAVVHGVFHQVPAVGVVLLVVGVFGILADRQL